jgi:hypothetical protein
MSRFDLAAISILALGAGCATYPKPIDSLAASEASVRAAQEVGAQKVPPAALQYELASEELGRAQMLLKDGENEKANGWLLRARADAELAIALTKEAKAQTDAQAAQQQLKDSAAHIHAVQ